MNKHNQKYVVDDFPFFKYNTTDSLLSDHSGFRNFDGTQKEIVCLGAAQTFGRFVNFPYPFLIENYTDYSVANFGWGGVGDHNYNDTKIIDYVNKAKVCIYLINSGRSISKYNENTKSNLDIGKRTSVLKSMYDNDFDKFMQFFIKNKKDYLNEHKSLINQITIPIIYIYVSKNDVNDIHEQDISKKNSYWLIWNFPHLVTKEMLMEITNKNTLGTFKQKSFQKLPGKIELQSLQIHNNIFRTDDYYPDQDCHYKIAEFCINEIKTI